MVETYHVSRAMSGKQSQEGPDRGWSWVIAFASFCCSFILAGIFRSSGVFFVALINEYGVTREEASWPVIMCIAVCNLIGIISGPLGHRFGVRVVVIFGALIAACGLSSCYFTTSLTSITILFGIVFGIGYGLVFTIWPVILNEYFSKLRATASGIANAGSCFGSVVLMSLLEYLIYCYGLSGCFLITGGIVLQVILAGALMRPPPWLHKAKNVHNIEARIYSPYMKPLSEDIEDSYCVPTGTGAITKITGSNQTKTIHDDLYSNKSQNDIAHNAGQCYKYTYTEGCQKICPDLPNCLKCGVVAKQSRDENGKDTYSTLPIDTSKATDKDENFYEAELCISVKHLENSISNFKTCTDSNESVLESKSSDNFAESYPEYAAKPENLTNHPKVSSTISTIDININELERTMCSNETNTPEPQIGITGSFKTVLTCPMFYIISVNNVSFFLLYHLYVTIIIDFSLDKGVPEKVTKYIIMSFAISDLFGRLCFGWITDRKYLRRTRFVMVCMILIGVVFFIFPLGGSLVWICTVSCIYGLLLGCALVIFPILLVDFFGIEMQAVAMGCVAFLNGVASLAWPVILGYFRDNMGSYSHIFYALGIISLTSSSLWLLENYFVKARKKNKVFRSP